MFIYLVSGGVGTWTQSREALKPVLNSYLIKTYIAFIIKKLPELKKSLSDADGETMEPQVSGPVTYLSLFPLWLTHASCLRGKWQSQAAGQQAHCAQHGQLHSCGPGIFLDLLLVWCFLPEAGEIYIASQPWM